MNQLNRADAEYYLRDVDLEHWLDASVVMRPRGMARVPITSLQALYILIEPNKGALPGLDFDELNQWLTKVIGDTELASKIRNSEVEADSYIDRCIVLYHCLHNRFRQYSEVLDEELVPETPLAIIAPTTNFSMHR